MYRYTLQCDMNKYCSVLPRKSRVCALCSYVQVADGELFWVERSSGTDVGYSVSTAH